MQYQISTNQSGDGLPTIRVRKKTASFFGLFPKTQTVIRDASPDDAARLLEELMKHDKNFRITKRR